MDMLAVDAKAVRKHVGTRTFEVGARLSRSGALSRTRRVGQTLKARCETAREGPFEVSVTLGPNGSLEGRCSCPSGAGGKCLHVAALLLEWQTAPEAFVELEPLADALSRRSREELVALVQELVALQPESELLVAAPRPVGGEQDGAVRRESFEQFVRAAFERGGTEWGAARGIASDIEKVRTTGDAFVEQEDYAGAAAVYEAICAEVMAHYREVRDDDGHLHRVIDESVAGLQRCAAHLPEGDPARASILRTLFEVTAFDISSGGICFGEGAGTFLLEHTTPTERRRVAGWVREALTEGSEWGRSSYGSLLLGLEGDLLDDEDYLRICRETGLLGHQVERLLERGRLQEALRAAQTARNYELLQLADLFLRHGGAEQVEHLVEERARTTRDERLMSWLQKRRSARGDRKGALELAVQRFEQYPSITGYKEVRRLAGKAGRWKALRPELLERASAVPEVKLDIHLAEGELEDALRLVKVPRAPVWSGPSAHDQLLEVARAAEKKLPDRACELYRQYAEALIETGTRGYYQEACRHLKEVRRLTLQTHGAEAWDRYVATLRERNSKRRALLDELRKARL